MRFQPSDRTDHVSDERLEVFGKLTPAQRLRRVEEQAQFLRLSRVARERGTPSVQDKPDLEPSAAGCRVNVLLHRRFL